MLKEKIYMITGTDDADFGCEGCREQDRGAVSLGLQDPYGNVRWIRSSEKELADLEADEGDIVTLSGDQETGGKRLRKLFHTRQVKPSDSENVIRVEQICFPPNEACSPQSMRERVGKAAACFLVAEKEDGTIGAMINGIATDETHFRDEFFTDISLHNPAGKNVMIAGVDVMPECRHLGLAHLLMRRYIRDAEKSGRKSLVLTNLDRLTSFYESMGYRDLGKANSSWGGETWHEMRYDIS